MDCVAVVGSITPMVLECGTLHFKGGFQDRGTFPHMTFATNTQNLGGVKKSKKMWTSYLGALLSREVRSGRRRTVRYHSNRDEICPFMQMKSIGHATTPSLIDCGCGENMVMVLGTKSECVYLHDGDSEMTSVVRFIMYRFRSEARHSLQ